MSEHNVFGDVADRSLGPDPADLDPADVLVMEADPTRPVDQPADIEDPSRYATEAEFYGDMDALLASPCIGPLDDDGLLDGYDALVAHLPNLEMPSEDAAAIRRAIKREAA